jgi:hypothetical protein
VLPDSEVPNCERSVSTPIAVTKSGAEGGRSAQCRRNRLRGSKRGSSHGQKPAVGATDLPGSYSSDKFSLRRRQEKHMMRTIKRSKTEIPGNLSNRPGSTRSCPRRRISAASRDGSETLHGQQINRLRGKVVAFLSLMLLLAVLSGTFSRLNRVKTRRRILSSFYLSDGPDDLCFPDSKPLSTSASNGFDPRPWSTGDSIR